MNFQIFAFARSIPSVDHFETRLSSPIGSDSECIGERFLEGAENFAHIGERFRFEATHDRGHRLAQFGPRLPGTHRLLHYRYNIIQSDVKVIIDFLPPTCLVVRG